jgi:hypothetical protein
MRAIRKTIFMTFLLALVTAGMATTGMAQFGTNDAPFAISCDVFKRALTLYSVQSRTLPIETTIA